jgi:hypothetical protein
MVGGFGRLLIVVGGIFLAPGVGLDRAARFMTGRGR